MSDEKNVEDDKENKHEQEKKKNKEREHSEIYAILTVLYRNIYMYCLMGSCKKYRVLACKLTS